MADALRGLRGSGSLGFVDEGMVELVKYVYIVSRFRLDSAFAVPSGFAAKQPTRPSNQRYLSPSLIGKAYWLAGFDESGFDGLGSSHASSCLWSKELSGSVAPGFVPD